VARVIAMANTARALERPVAGSLLASLWPDSPRPTGTDFFTLTSLPSAPYYARRVTDILLNSRGISGEPAETAMLLISELTTNAVTANLAAGGSDDTPIWVSLRHFREGLLIEIGDSSPTPPAVVNAGEFSECGRGLMLVEALSREWGYFPRAT